MRISRLLGPFPLTLLLLTLLLSLPVIVGCGGTSPPSNVSGGQPTTASQATATTAAVTTSGETATTAEISTTPSEVATTGTSESTPPSGATPTSGATSTSGATPGSDPGSGVPTTSSDGQPAPISPEEIKNAMESIGMGSPDQLQIYDQKTFGDYAAAYVMAADQNVYLVLLNDETGGWAILATYTGLGWDAVQADLQAKVAPEDLIEWAKPAEG
jgi:hypothetical protein